MQNVIELEPVVFNCEECGAEIAISIARKTVTPTEPPPVTGPVYDRNGTELKVGDRVGYYARDMQLASVGREGIVHCITDPTSIQIELLTPRDFTFWLPDRCILLERGEK